MAARSTSSFPVAFEASRLVSTRPPRFGAATDDGSVGLDADMGGVFLDRGGPTSVDKGFLVSDGGILDNIPLGRALDGIARAPADQPTRRFLIYAQPGIASRPPTAATADLTRRRAPAAVLTGLIGARLPAEDIIGDLNGLDAYNIRIDRAAALRRATFDPLTGPQRLRDEARLSWSGYRRMRAEEHQRLISTLLDDPIGYLGEDPFPRQVAGIDLSDDRWRSPLDDPRRANADGSTLLPNRERLAMLLTEKFTDRLPPTPPKTGLADSVVSVGALPLLRICQVLLEWTQYLESLGLPKSTASDTKAMFYRVGDFVRAAIERPRRLAWITLAATLPAGQDEPVLLTGSMAALSTLIRLPNDQAELICTALTNNDTAQLASAIQQRLSALDGLPTIAWSPATLRADQGTDEVDLRQVLLRQVLVPLIRELRAQHPAPTPGTHDAQPAAARPTPGWYLDRVIDNNVTADDLAALEVVCFPEFATALPGRRPVEFRRLSSAAETPLAPKFTALLSAAWPRDPQDPGRWWDPDNQDLATQQGLHVDLKLAGNTLGNFAAFLDQDWRRNDWLWGRMDAVPTLIELLVTPQSLRAFLATQPDPTAAVHALVLGPDTPGRTQLRSLLNTEVMTQPVAADIANEVAALLDATKPADPTAPPLPQPDAVRRALVAARQWEILAEELSGRDTANQLDDGAVDEFIPRLRDAVAAYAVGAEDLRTTRVAHHVKARLIALAEATSRVTVFNAQLLRPQTFGTPQAPSMRGRLTRLLLAAVARRSARRATRPRR
jgi:hypothetical protein